MNNDEIRSKQELITEIDTLKKTVQKNRRKLDITRKTLRLGYIRYNELLENNEAIIEQLAASKNANDPLTGLPGRAQFLIHLQASAGKTMQNDSVVILNIDRFSGINNRLGYLTGDKCLIEIADRLQRCIRATDILFKISGDEFALLLQDMADSDEVTAVAERVLTLCKRALFVNNQVLYINVSAGILLNTQRYKKTEEVLRNSCMALFKAKESGGNQLVVFDESVHTMPVNLLDIENDLAGAVKNNQLELYYQPIINIQTMMFTGFEALLRWNHPEKGFILPNDFIPVAEQTGLIIPLGRWVLKEACHRLKKLNKTIKSETPVKINVNISVNQIYQDDFVSHIKGLISDYEIGPSQLRLEITESLLMNKTKLVIEKLKSLKEAGISIVLDDFGSGYSSFSYLATLPVDTLKIDRSLILDAGRLDSIDKIIKTIIDLAHNMGINVVAEGVEKRRQFDTLKQMGCDKVQGFMIADPLSYEDAAMMIRRLNIIPA